MTNIKYVKQRLNALHQMLRKSKVSRDEAADEVRRIMAILDMTEE